MGCLTCLTPDPGEECDRQNPEVFFSVVDRCTVIAGLLASLMTPLAVLAGSTDEIKRLRILESALGLPPRSLTPQFQDFLTVSPLSR